MSRTGLEALLTSQRKEGKSDETFMLKVASTLNPVALVSPGAEPLTNPDVIAFVDHSHDLESALCNMLLTEDLLNLLQSPLSDMGFPLKKNSVYNVSYKQVDHYCTRTTYGDIALLHLPAWLLADPNNANSFTSFSYLFRGYNGLFFFSHVDIIKPAYERLAENWCQAKSFITAKFLGNEHLRELEDFPTEVRKAELKRLFKLDLSAASKRELDNETRSEIAEILIKARQSYPELDTKEFFERLLLPLALPAEWKSSTIQSISRDAKLASYKLLDAAVAQDVISSVLEGLIELRPNDAVFLRKIITSFEFVRQNN
ncbi:MAG: hypothetical protein C5B58_08545 [Acidobacteria bacterium]|nr:MAG: hypothetical protein C5B58_08545 [Acidobacteriota bacterium]